MELVVNEWFPEYLAERENLQTQKLLIDFLQRLKANNHKMVIKKGSPVEDKMLRLPKFIPYDAKFKIRYDFVLQQFVFNSSRCRLIQKESLVVLSPQVIEKLSEGNYISDQYLFETAAVTEDKTIITTDERLVEQMRTTQGFKLILLSDYLMNRF
jgi:hypothetical protein